MKTGISLLCLMGISLVFAVWDQPPVYHDFFLFSDQKLSYQTFVYFIFQHVFILGILYLWLIESGGYSLDYVRVFFFLQVCDLADFLLRYNEPFLNYDGFKVSFNIIAIGLYIIFLIYKGWRQP